MGGGRGRGASKGEGTRRAGVEEGGEEGKEEAERGTRRVKEKEGINRRLVPYTEHTSHRLLKERQVRENHAHTLFCPVIRYPRPKKLDEISFPSIYTCPTYMTCERSRASGTIRPNLKTVHFTTPFSSSGFWTFYTLESLTTQCNAFPSAHTFPRHEIRRASRVTGAQ